MEGRKEGRKWCKEGRGVSKEGGKGCKEGRKAGRGVRKERRKQVM